MALFKNLYVSLTLGVFSLMIVLILEVGEFAVNAKKRLVANLRPYIVRVGSEV